jgi:hypothetical protein
MDERKKMCVVFDIDETLIQFINSQYRARVWDILPDSEKAQFNYVEKGGHIIIFRPGLRELFAYFNGNRPLIQVGLWTYSEGYYCKDIATEIIKYAELPADFFLFLLSGDDIRDDDYPKNLNIIYKKFPYLSSFNTFIVDDLHGNITHPVNKENCIIVQPFAPFTTTKKREPLTEMALRRSVDDDVFKLLEEICMKVFSDIDGCESEDIDALVENPEPVFSMKRIKRMGLQNFLKKYATKTISLLTIGDAHQSTDFFEVDDAGSKGGARKTRRHTRRRKSKSLRKTQRQRSKKRMQKRRRTSKK